MGRLIQQVDEGVQPLHGGCSRRKGAAIYSATLLSLRCVAQHSWRGAGQVGTTSAVHTHIPRLPLADLSAGWRQAASTCRLFASEGCIGQVSAWFCRYFPARETVITAVSRNDVLGRAGRHYRAFNHLSAASSGAGYDQRDTVSRKKRPVECGLEAQTGGANHPHSYYAC